MKVSEKQLIMLTDIAKESLRIAGLFGGYDLPIRIQLINDIINQQSNELHEVDTDYEDDDSNTQDAFQKGLLVEKFKKMFQDPPEYTTSTKK